MSLYYYYGDPWPETCSPNYLEMFVQDYPDCLREVSCDGRFPLHHAVTFDNVPLDTIRLLVKCSRPEEVLRIPVSGKQQPRITVVDKEGQQQQGHKLQQQNLLNPNGSVLHCAIHGPANPLSIRLDVIELLLEKYPQLTRIAAPITGNLPLLDALEKENVELIRLLATADPLTLQIPCCKTGKLALHRALELEAKLETIHLFLQLYPEACQFVERIKNRYPLHIAASLSVPSSVLYTQTVFEAYPDAAQLTDVQGNLPLHLVKDQDTAAYLIQEYPQALSIRNSAGRLPIHQVVLSSIHTTTGSCACVPQTIQVLIRHHPLLISYADENGNLPLHVSLLSNSQQRQAIDESEGSAEGLSTSQKRRRRDETDALQIGCSRSDKPYYPYRRRRGARQSSSVITQLLVKQYPEACSMHNNDGKYPLHLALENPPEDTSTSSILAYSEMILQLIDQYPEATRFAEHVLGQLPFHVAVANYCNAVRGENNMSSTTSTSSNTSFASVSTSVLRRLLLCNPKAIKQVDRFGCLPLHCALEKSNKCRYYHCPLGRPCMPAHWALLLDEYPESIMEQDSQGRLPIHILLQQLNYQQHLSDNTNDEDIIIRSNWNEFICSELLTRYPAAVAIADGQGRLPLHLALQVPIWSSSAREKDGFWQFVQILVDMYPFALQIPTKIDHQLPLHILVGQPETQTQNCSWRTKQIEFIVREFPQALHKYNAKGYTPLHIACRQCNPSAETINCLLQESPECAMLLTSGSSGNKEKEGVPALFLACEMNANINVIFKLLEYSLELFSARSKQIQDQDMWNVLLSYDIQ